MKITAYRKKSSHAAGKIGAGTFYFIRLKGTCYQKVEMDKYQFNFKKEEIVCVDQEEALAFEGLPSEALASRWFPQMNEHDWATLATELGFNYSGAAMDILVAKEARDRGFKAIKYGHQQLQVVA